jgi:hypothetical protein
LLRMESSMLFAFETELSGAGTRAAHLRSVIYSSGSFAATAHSRACSDMRTLVCITEVPLVISLPREPVAHF